MDLATQSHLVEIRQALKQRLHELATELHGVELARQSALQEGAPEVGDRKDEAQRLQVADIGDAEAARDFAEAQRVEAALKRLDDGSYGDCLDCGEAIPLARLRVQPAAALCAGCQAAQEKAAGRH